MVNPAYGRRVQYAEGARFRARKHAHDRFPVISNPGGKHFRRQGAVPEDRLSCLYFFGKSGAGEAIRTPDPNLGKVVLYP